jgi:hypothetical protein
MLKWATILALGWIVGMLCHGCHGDDDIRAPRPAESRLALP